MCLADPDTPGEEYAFTFVFDRIAVDKVLRRYERSGQGRVITGIRGVEIFQSGVPIALGNSGCLNNAFSFCAGCGSDSL